MLVWGSLLKKSLLPSASLFPVVGPVTQKGKGEKRERKKCLMIAAERRRTYPAVFGLRPTFFGQWTAGWSRTHNTLADLTRPHFLASPLFYLCGAGVIPVSFQFHRFIIPSALCVQSGGLPLRFTCLTFRLHWENELTSSSFSNMCDSTKVCGISPFFPPLLQ